MLQACQIPHALQPHLQLQKPSFKSQGYCLGLLLMLSN